MNFWEIKYKFFRLKNKAFSLLFDHHLKSQARKRNQFFNALNGRRALNAFCSGGFNRIAHFTEAYYYEKQNVKVYCLTFVIMCGKMP